MSTERDDLPAGLSLGPVRRSHPRHQRVPAAPRPQTGRDWRSFAACRFTDPDLFLPISYSRSRGLEQAREAKAICAGCQVWGACLEFAIGTQQVHGIWGGMTEQERRQHRSKDRYAGQQGRRTRRLRPFPAHGGLALLLSDPLVRCPLPPPPARWPLMVTPPYADLVASLPAWTMSPTRGSWCAARPAHRTEPPRSA